MLALTNRFGNLDFATKSRGPDLQYFSLPLIGLVAYPGWVMTVLSSLGVRRSPMSTRSPKVSSPP